MREFAVPFSANCSMQWPMFAVRALPTGTSSWKISCLTMNSMSSLPTLASPNQLQARTAVAKCMIKLVLKRTWRQNLSQDNHTADQLSTFLLWAWFCSWCWLVVLPLLPLNRAIFITNSFKLILEPFGRMLSKTGFPSMKALSVLLKACCPRILPCVSTSLM